MDTSSGGSEAEFLPVQEITCANGFEGRNCEIPAFKKFCGSFPLVGGKCPYGKPERISHEISEYPGDFTKVVIHNPDFLEPIVADMDGWRLTIPGQMNRVDHEYYAENYPVEMKGLGWIDVEQNRLVYKLLDGHWQYDLRYRN